MNGRLRVAVLASGRGSNLQALLDKVSSGDLSAEIVLVISNSPRCMALERARSAGVPTECITKNAAGGRGPQLERFHQALLANDVELVVLAGFNLILSRATAEHYENRIINIHPSLLPAFAGGMAPQPQEDAIAYGVKVSGCTVHLINDDVDGGPVIAQVAVPVHDDDTPDSLAARILVEEHKILPAVVQWFAEGRVSVHGRIVAIAAEKAHQSSGAGR